MTLKSLKPLIFFFALTIILLIPSPTSADFGLDQYSSVVFNEENEAQVVSKFTFQNFTDRNIDFLALEIPGTGSTVVNAVQEIQEDLRICLKWEDACLEEDESGVCVKYERSCQAWRENTSAGRSYRYSSLLVQREKKADSILYSFSFDQEVLPGEQATVILSYTSPDYSAKKYGISKFSFSTPRLSYRTSFARVAVNAAPPLVLQKVAETDPFFENTQDIFTPLEISRTESPLLERISSRLQSLNGQVVEENGLAEQSSMVAMGSYSSSYLLLYWPWLGLALLIFVGTVALLVYVINSLEKKKKAKKKVEDFFSELKFRIILTAFINAAVLHLSYSLLTKLSASQFLSAYSGTVASSMVSFVLFILSVAVLFAPSLYFWKKQGAKKGMLAFTLVILFSIVIAFLYAFYSLI